MEISETTGTPIKCINNDKKYEVEYPINDNKKDSDKNKAKKKGGKK